MPKKKIYDGEKDRKTCPKCQKRGYVDELFGWRTIGINNAIPQSWCKHCRNNKPVPVKVVKKHNTFPPLEDLLKTKSSKEERQATKDWYHKEFPRDTNWNKRSVNFMLQKLGKKHRKS